MPFGPINRRCDTLQKTEISKPLIGTAFAIFGVVMRKHASIIALLASSSFLVACGGGAIGGGPNGNKDGAVGGQDSTVYWDAAGDAFVPTVRKDKGIQPNWDAFFANDPPPKYCGPKTGWTPPPLPGGTPDCPDDKNREGCECKKKGATAACWPGKRANRSRGVCKDGVTTCKMDGEVHLRWGPCEGYVLPTPGVTKGPGACICFSAGQWSIKNLSPCFVTYPGGAVWAVSTYMAGAQAKCPAYGNTPPPKPQAGQPWSTNTLKVDCAGQFKLCYTIKAGNFDKPAATDCALAEVCTTAWYAKKNVEQTLPPLPGWTGKDAACTAKFVASGGYGEMTVVGKSIECQDINDNGKPLVFHRIKYCPVKCAQNPNLPECKNCGNGASGGF